MSTIDKKNESRKQKLFIFKVCYTVVIRSIICKKTPPKRSLVMNKKGYL